MISCDDTNWKALHGFKGKKEWAAPTLIKFCDTEARPGYTTKRAHEYQDTKEVLEAKVELLAQLLTESRNCVIYSGAGLSTASGIGDYATKGGAPGEVTETLKPHLRSKLLAQPTYAHRLLAKLCRRGIVKKWVQQNHDGLPQKAGVPQHLINEIHGAWFDVSNPVVKMDGDLRTDLFEDLLAWEETTDLVLSLGTSMCGMNADRVFTTVAKKAKSGLIEVLGGVIISLQQTQYDDISAIRIFGKIDDVMSLLSQKLDLGVSVDERDTYSVPKSLDSAKVEDDVFLIPYDQEGRLLPEEKRKDKSYMTTLDLRTGSAYKVTQGPYKGDKGSIIGKNIQGHYRLVTEHKFGKKGLTRPWESVLGSWWIEAAVRGAVSILPIYTIMQLDVREELIFN